MTHKTCVSCAHCGFELNADGDEFLTCDLAAHMLNGEGGDALTVRVSPENLPEKYLIEPIHVEKPCGRAGLYWVPIAQEKAA